MATNLVGDSGRNINHDDEEDNFEVELINFRFCTRFHVSQHYLGTIIGKHGATKMRIERDTGTEIKIPRHRQGQTGDIAIFGSNASNVKAARKSINIMVMSSRLKQRSFTHFLSIPTNNEIVKSNFITFKESVLRECPSRGLDESMFYQPAKLHLTIGMLSLTNNEEIKEASKLLIDAKEKIIIPMLEVNVPLRVRIKGLASMNDDPHKMHVLYGRVQEEDGSPPGLLQNLADALVEHYNKAGYIDKWRDHVKLHVTLINSSHRSRFEEGGQKRIIHKEPFDGSMVLQKFGDFDFGVVEVTEIQLSQLGMVGPEGYYQSAYTVSCR